jgi:protease-4
MPKDNDTLSDSQWQRGLLEKLASASLKEQRAARRWGVFFKLLIFGYFAFGLIIWLAIYAEDAHLTSEKHTAVVELKGTIAPEGEASADKVIKGLREAFKHKGTKGVVLRLNSPGGSPVQSAYIYDEIKRLRTKYPKIPLYAVVSDLCASGCYFVASAADKIYANESSVLGSIGVLMNGFGFVDAMDKLGVERRLLTAGEHKGLLDAFSPLKEGEKAHVQTILDQLHHAFIAKVKAGRGKQLKDDDRLFSGLIWGGTAAKDLGLIDEFGSTSFVARDVIGAEETVNFTQKRDVFERFAERLGAGAAKALVQMPEFVGSLNLR